MAFDAPWAQPCLPLPITLGKCGHRRGAGRALGVKAAGWPLETLREAGLHEQPGRAEGGPKAWSCKRAGGNCSALPGDMSLWLLEPPSLPLAWFLPP